MPRLNYIKFGEIPSICSQDIVGKRKSGVNEWPLLCFKCAINDVELSQARSCQFECIYQIWWNSLNLF